MFVGVGDPERGRAWLRGLLDQVRTAEWRTGPPPSSMLNVALTHAGLGALGVAPRVIESFSAEFKQGMAGRARLLGDVGPSDRTRWAPGLGTDAAHVLVTLNALDETALGAAVADLRAGLEAAGSLSIVYQQDTSVLGTAREHFGFADGFSQPAIEGIHEARVRGGGVPLEDGSWRALAVGEFILGYGDEETRVDRQGRLPTAPAGALGRNGTYMVWRKLHQDVALFRRILRDAAAGYEQGGEEALAAKMVGRWRNGTPLVVSPAGERPGFDPRPPEANAFA